MQPLGCRAPYLLQTNPNHKHYGCVALVDMGLMLPRYVHGDYDLYAIIPAGKPFDPNSLEVRNFKLRSAMAPEKLSLQERLRLTDDNKEGPLSFRVATYINNRIEAISQDLLGALMVNHGEQVNVGPKGHTNEPVLAIISNPVDDKRAKILFNPLGLYSPLLAVCEKHCDEIFDFGQFILILIPRPLAAGMFIRPFYLEKG